MGAAKAGRLFDQRAARKERLGPGRIGQFKADQEAAVRHLRADGALRRVARQTWVAQAAHGGVVGQPGGDHGGAGAHPLQPHLQRLKPAMHQEGLERPRHRAGHPPPVAHPCHQARIAARDMTEQHVGMARRRLGVGGHHQIGAQVQRPLQQRRHRGVVGNHPRPRRAGAGGDGGDVDHVQPGVRRGFQVDHRRAVKAGLGIVAGRQFGDLDAQGFQEAFGEHPGDVIAVGRDDQPVAGLQRGEKCRGDGGHAGRKGDRLGLFQQGKLGLDRLTTRVGIAAVDVVDALDMRQVEGGRGGDRRHHRIAGGKTRLAVMQKPRDPGGDVVVHGVLLAARAVGGGGLTRTSG